MSDNNNTLLIGGAVLAFLYMQRQAQTRALVARPGAVASMPGSVGTGLAQIATGAVSGFFRQIAASPKNNTSTTGFPSQYPSGVTMYDDPYMQRGGNVNEAVPDYGNNSYDFGDYSGGAFA